MPCVPGFLFFDVCFLRDPLDRIRSMYDYFREKPVEGDPMSDFGNRLPLGGFVAKLIEEMPWYIHDAQVNLLANGIANDIPEPGDFDRAVSKMLRTSFLGVVDRLQGEPGRGRTFPAAGVSHARLHDGRRKMFPASRPAPCARPAIRRSMPS